MNVRERGFTMVDTVIAVAILALVLGIAYPGFKIANDTIATSGTRGQATRVGGDVLRRILKETRSGDVQNVQATTTGPALTLRRIRSDASLAQFETEGSLDFGAETVVIQFRQTDTLSETVVREDINRDGDMKDLFALGHIEVVENGRVRPLMTSTPVILGLPGFAGDLDGDGKSDPLFDLNGRSLTVSVHLFQRTPGGLPMLVALTGAIHLRNYR